MNPEQPSTKENNLGKLIGHLIKLREDYLNDIPEEDISAKPIKPYKVRHAWFQAILWDLEGIQNLAEQDLIKLSPKAHDKIERFKERVLNDDFKKRMTTKEDIDLADSLLDSVIKELKNEKLL